MLRKGDLVAFRILQEPQSSFAGRMVRRGDSVQVREPRDYLVADDLVEPVASDLIRAAVPKLQDAPRLDATQREIKSSTTPINDEHVAAHEPTDRAL